ncbi:MAG: hypothetical protein ABEJ64_01355 [Candidatus Nanohaloarchaea archaeon]
MEDIKTALGHLEGSRREDTLLNWAREIDRLKSEAEKEERGYEDEAGNPHPAKYAYVLAVSHLTYEILEEVREDYPEDSSHLKIYDEISEKIMEAESTLSWIEERGVA